MSAVLAAALEYAARGWYVLPLDPHTHLPVSPPHNTQTCDHRDPRCKNQHTSWEERATTDLQQVTRIWKQGTWDVGIACGPSHLLILDTATTHHLDAENTVTALAHAHTPLPPTWTVAPPLGGLHRYYTTPHPLPTTHNQLGPHINTTGTNGYIIAPPSTTPNGTYHNLITHPTTPLPTWIAQLLTPLPPKNQTHHPQKRNTSWAATRPPTWYTNLRRTHHSRNP